MSLTLYEVGIAPIIRNIEILQKILKKSHDHVGGDESKFIHAKLVADMGDLIFQIQRISDTSKGVAVRLGGAEPVALADDEKDFPAIVKRLDRTLDILKSVKPESINGKEDTEVVWKTQKGENRASGKDYLLNNALPNFYFHFVTTYAILRKEGFPVGKHDYLGTV